MVCAARRQTENRKSPFSTDLLHDSLGRVTIVVRMLLLRVVPRLARRPYQTLVPTQVKVGEALVAREPPARLPAVRLPNARSHLAPSRRFIAVLDSAASREK